MRLTMLRYAGALTVNSPYQVMILPQNSGISESENSGKGGSLVLSPQKSVSAGSGMPDQETVCGIQVPLPGFGEK